MGGQNQLPLNLSGVIVAVMLILAAVLNRPPLESARPLGSKLDAEPSGPFEQIPARLWEDPFEAVAETRAGVPATDPCIPAPAADSGAATPPPAAADCRPVVTRYLDYLSGTNQETRLLMLPVMAPGAPYPVDREQRLRMRAAVHAGLAAGNYLPLFGNRLGRWTWQTQNGPIKVPFEAFAQDRASVRRVVLVLWLDESFIGRDAGLPRSPGGGGEEGPLCMLDRMLADLGYPAPDAGGGRPLHQFHSAAVRLIGPSFSDSLQAIYAEMEGKIPACRTGYVHLENGARARSGGAGSDDLWGDDPVNFKIVSPTATAPSQNLIDKPMPDGTFCIGRGEARPCARVELHRTISTDDRLMAALVDELRLRGVDPTTSSGYLSRIPNLFASLNAFGRAPDLPGDQVVLISEWDTKFGRTLPSLFEAEVGRRWCAARCPRNGNEPAGESCARQCRQDMSVWRHDPGKPLPWVRRFHYVRGLDGNAGTEAQRPGEQRTSRAVTADLATLATAGDAEFKEPAVGTNQYDYLRRLTRAIADHDRRLRDESRGSVKAFGILGTDFYDKLLILQALKERFPAHVYFTTDLDARYLDTKVFRWTRNLVVATPFDLTVPAAGGATTQMPVPIFRDSLQTSIYLAVQHSLAGGEEELAGRVAAQVPLRFEVGWERFYRLTDGASPADPAAPPITPAAAGWDTGLAPFALSHIISLLVIVVAATALILHTVPAAGRTASGLAARLRPGSGAGARPAQPIAGGSGIEDALGRPQSDAARRGALVLIGLYLLVGLGWPLLRLEAIQTEPLALFGGVSVWPSELLRLVAGLVAVLCLLYGCREVCRQDRAIADGFDLPIKDADRRYKGGFFQWYADGRADDTPRRIGERTCRLFGEGEVGAAGPQTGATAAAEAPSEPPCARGPDPSAPRPTAAAVWRDYRRQAALGARARRVLPAALLFFALALVVLFGFGAPMAPHRGAETYVLSLVNGLFLLGLPFLVLLFAAWDEALLCGGLLRHLGRGVVWTAPEPPPAVSPTAEGETRPDAAHRAPPDGDGLLRLPCRLPDETHGAIGHWLTMELIARRTEPSATLIHLPFIVILFALLSLSTRFDNWDTPNGVVGLIGLSVLIALGASLWLRRTAHRIRQRILDDLTDEVSSIRFSKATTRSEKLEELVARIKAIHEGAYTKWYNEPVVRGLAWVLAVGILVITEYGVVG